MFEVKYAADHKPETEEVEADECVLEEGWFLFKKYLPGRSLTTILRIPTTAVIRVELKQT